MKCTPINLADGARAIVCTSRRRAKRCRCGSGHAATRLCDWKLGGGKTCDAELCKACTHSPATDKDLCPTHSVEWKARQTARTAHL